MNDQPFINAAMVVADTLVNCRNDFKNVTQSRLGDMLEQVLVEQYDLCELTGLIFTARIMMDNTTLAIPITTDRPRSYHLAVQMAVAGMVAGYAWRLKAEPRTFEAPK